MAACFAGFVAPGKRDQVLGMAKLNVSVRDDWMVD
jgi:hypothetical protein